MQARYYCYNIMVDVNVIRETDFFFSGVSWKQQPSLLRQAGNLYSDFACEAAYFNKNLMLLCENGERMLESMLSLKNVRAVTVAEARGYHFCICRLLLVTTKRDFFFLILAADMLRISSMSLHDYKCVTEV